MSVNDWKLDFRRKFSDWKVNEWIPLYDSYVAVVLLLSNARPNDRNDVELRTLENGGLFSVKCLS